MIIVLDTVADFHFFRFIIFAFGNVWCCLYYVPRCLFFMFLELYLSCFGALLYCIVPYCCIKFGFLSSISSPFPPKQMLKGLLSLLLISFLFHFFCLIQTSLYQMNEIVLCLHLEIEIIIIPVNSSQDHIDPPCPNFLPIEACGLLSPILILVFLL